MACNCKKNVNKLIKTVEEINKSKRASSIGKSSVTRKYAYRFFKILTYGIFGIVLFCVTLPIILYQMGRRKNG